jgi:hypothetical protein
MSNNDSKRGVRWVAWLSVTLSSVVYSLQNALVHAVVERYFDSVLAWLQSML